MFDNRKFEKINRNLSRIMETDLDNIAFAFVDGENSMEIPDMYEFCKWWVKKYPDKFAYLKGSLYRFREDRAKLFHSIDVILRKYADSKRANPFVIFQLQMLTNNCIDQTNSTCSLVQTIVKMCEKILKGE